MIHKQLGTWTVVALALLGASQARSATLSEALAHLDSDDVLVADAAVEEIVGFGAPAVDSLLGRLEAPGRDVRAGAIRGLGLLRDRRASGPLQKMLQASLDHTAPDTMESRYLRILLIQALGRLEDPTTAPLLRRAATSSDPFEKAHAAVSLVVSAQDPGYDLIHECVADHDPAIRALAAEGLGETGDDRAKALLLDLARDPSWVVRDAAFHSLGRFAGDASVRAALEQGAHDPSWYVRQTVAEAAAGRKR